MSASASALLILAEGFSGDPHYGKTMRGVLRYRREDVVAILDSTRPARASRACRSSATSPPRSPFARRRRSSASRPRAGGSRPPGGRSCGSASGTGSAIENGLHEFLADDPELVALARSFGVTLTDLRRAPAGLDVPTGANLEVPGKIVLTVGSDCAIGKMTVSLELDREARARGIASVFVPTGPDGDRDRRAGGSRSTPSSRTSSPAPRSGSSSRGSERGGDLLLVEGQGAISHPAYSGVTLGLIHGSAPHAFVLCHMAGATEVEGYPGYPLLSLPELVALHEAISLTAAPALPSPASRSTRATSTSDAARAAIAAAEAETGLVADDPVRFGAARLLDAVLAHVEPLA